MNNTEVETSPPSRGSKHICVVFASEAHYQVCVSDLAQYRQYLTPMIEQYPELFPQAIREGYTFHDPYRSRKQGIELRRIKLKASGAVFTLRPSFLLPYCIGRNAMFWYRAWLSFGRLNLVGTTVKRMERMPQDLVADEKITWLAGEEVVVPTTVGGGCVLGISVATIATSAHLQEAYGKFVVEATVVFPNYQVRSVCTDGFQATRDAWRQLVPHLTLVLCFLHSILKLTERCRGALRHQVLDRAWFVYQAATKGQFSQRLRRLAQWGRTPLNGSLAQMIAKMAHHRADFTPAYDCPQAARTTKAVVHIHNHLDRTLYAMRYCHGQQASARMAVRAWAALWNFHPYGPRLRQAQPVRSSPFADLNGFHYHANWLHNLLVASSIGGLRL